MPDTENEIIFLGNSITDGAEWYELFDGNPNIKNRGIGGDDTDGVLSRLDEVTSSNPKQIFIMIGTNDLAYGKTVEYVIKNHQKIIDQIQAASPNTEIIMQAVLPVEDAIHWTRPNASILEINKKLKDICQLEGIQYLDIHTTFSDEKGKLNKKYSIDGLHLNGAGYLKWKEVLMNYIDQ